MDEAPETPGTTTPPASLDPRSPRRPPPGAGAAEEPPPRWAFRRFDADAQAQAASDTWDELHRRGLSIMAEIDQDDGALYEASRRTEESMRTLAIPRTTDCTAAARQSTAAARALLKILQEIAPPPPPAPADRGDGGDATGGAGGEEEDEEGVYIVPLNGRQIAGLCAHLETWVGEASKLAARTNATIENAQGTRKRLGELDTRIRDFILTIWSLNAEKAKAYPPFFSNIGPIESTLYGIGRTTTTTTSTTATSST